ncbi:MAG: hypothetical protein JOZ16_05275 [Methylobacteriaceae bacterium]|nr:hypothetical protein [Methylobacteriaceae bacterium]
MLCASALLAAGGASAQSILSPTPAMPLQVPDTATPRAPGTGSTNRAEPPAPVEPGQGLVYLSATFTPADAQPVRAGIRWRVFEERAEADGSHKLVMQSDEAAPFFALPDGAYIVHAAFGLAGVTRRIVVNGQTTNERVILNAGGLSIIDVLGAAQLPSQKLQIQIYVPDRNGSEAKLIFANAKPKEVLGLPEGNYRIISTLLDTTGISGQTSTGNTTNSVVSADLRVQAGKVTEATLRHRAATMTLKLVNAPGGEALANTTFSVLTPGGDSIRELIGAFPSLVLAEGEYIAIARHDGKTFQTTFKVQSTLDRDVEVVAN